MTLSMLIKLIFFPLLAYLIGSIPCGVILTWIFTDKDIRKQGSGNIGATNVRRVAGTILGSATLAGDVFKGLIPVVLAKSLTGLETDFAQLYVSLIAVCTVMGHLFPIYFGFRSGGKGVATAGGCFLAISPFSVFVAILSFILLVCITNRASVGSLTGSAILPVAVWKSTGSEILTGCAVIIAGFIWYKHQENIKRLIARTEPGL